ncbi:peptide-methionine (S)-S-oxide reductase MsrA [Lysobacter sp. TY2-98]|uniref:peptide-methionine (S)-S-oxide reductase MsrA n=1 Tax=Lysobacter sp. TY2-98 TaxID=2290922 RepID=UPI000E207050|nr:peptide-methionine (S)-S-oxide reductase MsrA [Lysobacter sp. TY2-98]AXK73660.1 peptide-methionine (S)-S-oxide reductase MsrA [Lysobacter sp. TY2-98]
MLGIGAHKQRMPRAGEALPGRETAMPIRNAHHVHGRPIQGEFAGMEQVQFGLGCFWGAERLFWKIPGVYTTAVGYSGGETPNATYREVCSGMTGHTEAVLVVYDPKQVTFDALLKAFWEGHDPTQGMRQGNDTGTQYRSAIYCTTQAQYDAATASRDAYQQRLDEAGLGTITTEIRYPAPTFYYAEDEHQQYLSKIPNGYCGLGGTGVSCPIGAGIDAG